MRSLTPNSSWSDSQTTSSSGTHSNSETAAGSAFFNKDFADPFGMRSEFAEPDLGALSSQNSSQPQQDYLARPMGSFDSGFYDTESIDFSFGDVDTYPGPALDATVPPQPTPNITSDPTASMPWMDLPPPRIAAATSKRNSPKLDYSGSDPFGEKANSRAGKRSAGTSKPGPALAAIPATKPFNRSPLVNPPSFPDPISPRTSDTPEGASPDDMLVSLIHP